MIQTSYPLGPTIIRSVHTSSSQHPGTGAKDDRLEYLLEEHRFLQGHVASLAARAESLERKFADLTSEVAKVVSTDNSLDIQAIKATEPVLSQKTQLLAIVQSQKALIDSLKANKKRTKRLKASSIAEEEGVPRELSVNRERLTNEGKNVDNVVKIDIAEPLKASTFSTFGKLPEENPQNKTPSSTIKKTKRLPTTDKKKAHV